MDHSSTPVFVVRPAGTRWSCRQEGGGPSSEHGSRAEAMDRAREMARAAGHGRVLVHDAYGTVEQRWTFRPRAAQRPVKNL